MLGPSDQAGVVGKSGVELLFLHKKAEVECGSFQVSKGNPCYQDLVEDREPPRSALGTG